MRVDTTALPAVGTEGDVLKDASSAAGPSYTGRPLEKGACLSYWLQNVRCDPLLDHRTTENLPSEADVVIIGSGVSGHLLSPGHHGLAERFR